MREYVTRTAVRPEKISAKSIPPKGGSGVPRSGDIESEVDAEDYLSRTVYEEFDLIDIGVMDKEGNPIMARKKMDPIGFVRRK